MVNIMKKALSLLLACTLLPLCSCHFVEPKKNDEVDVVAHLVVPTQLSECLEFYAVYEDFEGKADSTKIQFQSMTESEGISYVIYESALFKTSEVGASCKIGFVARYRTDIEWTAPTYEARVIIGAAAVDFYNGTVLDYLSQAYANFDQQTLSTCDPEFILEEMENKWRGAGKAFGFGTKWDETYGLLATSDGEVNVPESFWPNL